MPSSIYSWFLKPLSLLHSGFPTKKSWVVAYFFNFFHFFVGKKFFFIKVLLCNFLVRTLQCKKKFKKIIFWPSKYQKTTPKSCILKQKFRRFRNFLSKPSYCPTAQIAEFMFPNVAQKAHFRQKIFWKAQQISSINTPWLEHMVSWLIRLTAEI